MTIETVHREVLGPVDQIPVGEGRAFGVGSDQIAVFRLRDGSLRAVSAVCPHRGGPIADGQIDGRVVLCPLHLNSFELDSGCSTTGQAPLRSYPVQVDDDHNIILHIAS
jgi:nitrite reductase/ring-hydroxylating ferredoxin subunit